MKTFAARRRIGIAILVVLAIAVLVVHHILSVSLYPTAHLTGWALLALVVMLTLYNIRKRLTFLPLGSSATWLQIHIYAGLLTFAFFLVHVDYRVPNGIFETALAFMYLAVFISGVIGLVLSRAIPARLTSRREEVIYERIPVFLRQIREEVEELVLGCITETDSTAVPEFYVRRLKPFFERPRHFWQHLLHSNHPRQKLLMDIQANDRYLNEPERELMKAITERVCNKDDLDYQFALQTTLKYWLFVHIPLTYGLLVFAVFHVVLVHAFFGGIR